VTAGNPGIPGYQGGRHQCLEGEGEGQCLWWVALGGVGGCGYLGRDGWV
jgi:hypothetical protein